MHQLPPPPHDRASARLYVSIEVAVRKSQRAYLRRVASRVRDQWGLQVTTLAPKGPVGPTLTSCIRDAEVDLVVMTTHGRGALERAVLGSVADHLVRSADVPLLLIRPDETTAPESASPWGPREILVPLDGSRLAESALPPATDLARLLKVPLALVQIVVPMTVTAEPPLAFPSGYDDRLTEIRLREAQDYLDGMAERLRDQGLAVSGVASIGWSVPGALLDLARSSGLVAIATHGRSGLKRAVLGSVADKLVRTTEVPVLVVRPRGRGA